MSHSEVSKAEQIKIDSLGLRGTISEEIDDPSLKKFSHANEQLIKFHGMYQQKDRDRRASEDRHLGPKPFALMIRGRIPGGRMTSQQWLAWDDLASRYSDHGLRLTTRQSLQLHGVARQNIRTVVRAITSALSSTTGACGDVVRNVMQAPNPLGDPKISAIDEPCRQLSQHFEVKSNAYLEVFVDGNVVHREAAEADSIYGRTYLPRKFKVAVTIEGDNSVDLFTQDLTFAATFADDSDHIAGYHVFVGGGMGMSHNNPATFPRLADYLGWIPRSGLIPVAEAIVCTQRDFGDRSDRAHARLKYTIADRGLPWFRREVEKRSQVTLVDRPIAGWQVPDYLGWHQHANGTYALGFHLLSGRLVDRPGYLLKSTIRHIIGEYQLDVTITAEQDLILTGITSAQRTEIQSELLRAGIDPSSPSPLMDRAMTCVALPMCVKALAEAERIGPETFTMIEGLLQLHRLDDRAPTVRITGCPNGCARPYAAEIGLVGQLPKRYALYLGGNPEGTRLAFRTLEKVRDEELPDVLDRLFSFWAQEGNDDERLGDFVHRVDRVVLDAVLAGGQDESEGRAASAVNTGELGAPL